MKFVHLEIITRMFTQKCDNSHLYAASSHKVSGQVNKIHVLIDVSPKGAAGFSARMPLNILAAYQSALGFAYAARWQANTFILQIIV
jgi:hypothetical protein